MDRSRHASPLLEVAEPPRDGEFFFEEAGTESRRVESGRFIDSLLGRHPYLAVGLAAVFGMLIASVLMRL